MTHPQIAADYFGTTVDWKETGYLLPDGSQLDFSGAHEGNPEHGHRCVDHRDIRDAFGDDYGGTSHAGGMVAFMSEGAIRICPECCGINIQIEPTDEQYKALRRFILFGARLGCVVDYDDTEGRTIHSDLFDPGTSPGTVIKKISDFFEKKQKSNSIIAQFHCG